MFYSKFIKYMYFDVTVNIVHLFSDAGNFLINTVNLRYLKAELYSKLLIQQNFNGSNTDGSFIMAVSNSFSSPLETTPIAADLG